MVWGVDLSKGPTASCGPPGYGLNSMRLSEDRINGALMFSWCQLTEDVNGGLIISRFVDITIKV